MKKQLLIHVEVRGSIVVCTMFRSTMQHPLVHPLIHPRPEKYKQYWYTKEVFMKACKEIEDGNQFV